MGLSLLLVVRFRHHRFDHLHGIRFVRIEEPLKTVLHLLDDELILGER
jgi:hypothetical protein